MAWMQNDIEDLLEIVEQFCDTTDCKECPFEPMGKYRPCLKDICRSLNTSYNLVSDMCLKFVKGVRTYVADND